MENTVKAVSDLAGVPIEIEISSEIAAEEVDETAVAIMAEAIRETVEEQFLVPPIVTPGGEDFHYYTLKRPQIKATQC